jgi:hydrogenase maturation protease
MSEALNETVNDGRNEPILVACVGNIFLGDDGFGFEVARALAACPLPPEVEVRDYGIRGLDLVYALLRPWKAVVLVDAIARGGDPGTLYLLQPSEIECEAAEAAPDAHAMDPVRMLATARSMGKISAAVYILGCEPQDWGEELEGRIGLSAPVAAAIPQAVSMIREITQKLMIAADVEHAA